MIREVTTENELRESARVIRASFRTVADEFNLTEQNCPTNPAFMTLERLTRSQEKGAKLFGLYENERQIGFVAVEKSDAAVYFMERLAVLPESRHRGFGKKLLDIAYDYVNKQGGEKISVGIIDANLVLKNWYKTHGYIETSTKQFKHLPFAICFLEKRIDA